MRRRLVATMSLALMVAAALPHPTAMADTSEFPDGKTTAGPMDIHRVVVVNQKRLQIRLVVDNLQRRTGRSASVRIDTNSERAGAEFVIVSYLYDSHWQIFRARGTVPLNCPIDQRLLFDRDVIIWTTGRACLGKYSRVRVSAEARKGGVIDHNPSGGIAFTPWVARG